MKSILMMIRTMAVLLSLGLGLSGCFANNDREMMDDSMSTPMETIEKTTMKGTMPDKMNTMKEDAMAETMPTPMESMKKDAMETGMTDSMK